MDLRAGLDLCIDTLTQLRSAIPVPVPVPVPGTLTGVSYYMSPTGSDSANGITPGTAWLSPSHAVKAGDTIWAAPGMYSAANFAPGKWGTVTAPSADGQYLAKVRANGAVGSCVIASASACARIDKSNWALIGFMGVTMSDTSGAFECTPSAAVKLHHVAFINCISKSAYRNGFAFYSYYANKAYSFDYAAVIGCIAHDSAKGSALCHSGISLYQPVLFDTKAGTHLYIAGNFCYNNITPLGGCGGGTNSDGNGIILDNFSLTQRPGTVPAYAGQTVVENNLLVGNGWAGMTTFQSAAGIIKVRKNTLWGNIKSPTNDEFYAGELLANAITGGSLIWVDNIAKADRATEPGPSNYPTYGAFIGSSPGSFVSAAGNVFNGLNGHHQSSNSSAGFAYGANSNVDPGFANPFVPGSPSPTTEATTVILMSGLISGFKALAGNAAGKGYKAPDVEAANADFPVWLKGAVPSGLISLPAGYAAGSSF